MRFSRVILKMIINQMTFCLFLISRNGFSRGAVFSGCFFIRDLPQLAKLVPSLFAMLQTFVQFDAYHSRLLYFNIVTCRQKSWETHWMLQTTEFRFVSFLFTFPLKKHDKKKTLWYSRGRIILLEPFQIHFKALNTKNMYSYFVKTAEP